MNQLNKINKELTFDYGESDRAVREETEQCQRLLRQMMGKHTEQRKASDARISRFVEEKCAIIRDLIERENKEREMQINNLQESLNRDLGEIRERLEVESQAREQRVEGIHAEFLEEYERMQIQFRDLVDKQSESETEFYQMLREVVKKVKGEVAQGRKQREQMEQSILILIEKICDKAMEQSCH